MSGVDERLIGKRQEFVVQRVVKVSAEFVGAPPERRPEIRAADVPDKQRITREDGERLGPILLKIEHQDGD